MSDSGPASFLVLGARGFIGSAFVEELRRRGRPLEAVDLDNYAACSGARADVLINANGNSKKFLAAGDPAGEFDLSVRSVVRSLHDFHAGLYVHLSTMDVYPDKSDPGSNDEDCAIEGTALSPYGFHKHLAELCVRHYARRWLIFRMGGFVGPGLRKNSVFDMLTDAPLFVDPDSEYQYLHTRDLARIVLDVIESGTASTVLNVAGSGRVSLRDVAGWIPGYEIRTRDAAPPRERCHLNIERIKALHSIPATRETVRRFVADVRAGREVLG